MNRRKDPFARRLAALLGLAVLATTGVACQDYVFEPVDVAMIVANNTVETIEDKSKADILFVIDDSGSMAGEQVNLATNISAFINGIEAINDQRIAKGLANIDYQIAIVSTSVKSRYLVEGNELIQTTYQNSGASCSTNLDYTTGQDYPAGTFLAAPGNQAVLKRNALSKDEIIRQFQENAQLGTCGAGQEQGLRAMKLALEKQPDFVRPDSRLLIAFLSDEQDCSDSDDDLYSVTVTGGAQTDNCVTEAAKADGGLLGPVSDYVTFIQSLGADSVGGAIVSAIANGDGTFSPGVCVDTNCENNCTLPDVRQCFCGGVSGGGRYMDFVAAISPESVTDSVCQDNFSTTLEELAARVEVPDRILLKAVPHERNPALILLKILRGNNEIACRSPATAAQTCDGSVDWTYDEVANAIALCKEAEGGGCELAEGDKFVVSFIEQACSVESPCTPGG